MFLGMKDDFNKTIESIYTNNQKITSSTLWLQLPTDAGAIQIFFYLATNY